jgi:CRISPR/Cas system CSM-associated protein Csm2 small subunit
MEEGLSRAECARRAGYSKYMTENPKIIETSKGFNLAMATVATETGKTYLKALYEMNDRDLSKESTKTILDAIKTLSMAWAQFVPKQQSTSELSSVFADVIDVTPTTPIAEIPLQNKDN